MIMARKNSKKVIETNEIIEEIPESIEENNNIEENNEDLEVDIDNEDEILEERVDEHIETELKKDDIKEILNNKKKISEKQRIHLEKSRSVMKEREKEKRNALKMFNELKKMDIDLKDLIENAKALKIKKDYEAIYGRKDNVLKKNQRNQKKKHEEEIYEKPKQKIKFHQDLMLLEIN